MYWILKKHVRLAVIKCTVQLAGASGSLRRTHISLGMVVLVRLYQQGRLHDWPSSVGSALPLKLPTRYPGRQLRMESFMNRRNISKIDTQTKLNTEESICSLAALFSCAA